MVPKEGFVVTFATLRKAIIEDVLKSGSFTTGFYTLDQASFQQKLQATVSMLRLEGANSSVLKVEKTQWRALYSRAIFK